MNNLSAPIRLAGLLAFMQLFATQTNAICDVLICEDNVTVSMNNDCDGTINSYFLIVNQNACGGPKIVEFFDEYGNALGDTITGAEYIGQTLDFWVEHKWSGNECWGTVSIVDTKGPQIECENKQIKCTEDTHPDIVGTPFAQDNCTEVESLTYEDEIIDFGCGEHGFEGYFAPSNWTVWTTNGDGGVDVTGAPNSVLVEGADSSPYKTTPRYITKYYIEIPAEGYISFDWNSIGGSNFNVDAFYVTVNNVCIQLSFDDVTSGSYTTWLLEAGDILSFEQASDGTSNHVDTEISNFQFLTTTYQIINRTWTATDSWDNSRSCTQVIELQRAGLTDVYFPANRDGIMAPMLDCGDGYDPAITGMPFLDDDGDLNTTDDQYDIENNDCTFNLVYSDDVIETCPGSELIVRTWTIVDWCTSDILEEVQLIKRFDETPPTIATCPENITVGTNTIECGATVSLPTTSAFDECIGLVDAIPSWGFGAGYQEFNQVPLGTHTVLYTATDGCGNAASCTMEVTITDNTPPTVVCDAFTVAAISADGNGWVFAENLNDGTYDLCCLDENGFEVKRVGMGDDQFASTLPIDCNDIGAPLMVIMRAKDCNGNTNICQVEVSVEDNEAPSILAPNDVTIDCNTGLNNLEVYGIPQVFDNCDFTLTETNTETLNNCGQGTIVRTWTATDLNGNINSASQTIFVENQQPWNTNGDQIIWPADYTVNTCSSDLDPSNLPAAFSLPTFVGEEACELVAVSQEDEILWFSEPACFLLFRKWTVLDWCQYDENNPNSPGIWEHTQTLEVTDAEAPVFTNVENEILVEINSIGNCSANVSLPTPEVDDCSDHILFSAYGELGSGFNFTNVEAGLYTMTYTAADGCGNSSSYNFTVRVEDTQAPTPVCIDGLVVEIDEDGLFEIDAESFNLYSFDNCSAANSLSYSFSSNITEETLTLSCDNVGITNVEIWVTDETGNQDLCTTFINLNDNLNNCYENPQGEASIQGDIYTEFGAPIGQVKIFMEDTNELPAETDNNGQYLFSNMPQGSTYTLRPEKNMNPTNGVSSFDLVLLHDHILGEDLLDSPYQLIAADANNDGIISTLDLLAIQRVILVLDDEFPNNQSWRFVPTDYEFEDPSNPFSQSFPESMLIENISGEMLADDFIGIKIGDLNGNVNPMNMTGNVGGTLTPLMAEKRSIEKVEFNLENQDLVPGELIEVDIIIEDIVDLLTWQSTINFNEQALKFIEVKHTVSAVNAPVFGYSKLEMGAVTALWKNKAKTSLEKGSTFCTLVFEAQSHGKLSDHFYLSSDFTSSIAYNLDGEQMQIETNFYDTRPTIQNEFYSLSQNYPNPVYSETTIEFTLPEKELVQFQFYDLSGKLLKNIENTYEEGVNQITISKKELGGVNGIIIYKMNTKSFKESKKMIIPYRGL